MKSEWHLERREVNYFKQQCRVSSPDEAWGFSLLGTAQLHARKESLMWKASMISNINMPYPAPTAL